MKTNHFSTLTPHVDSNTNLRTPQIEAFNAVASHDFQADEGREVSVVLPVGCGKSGLLALAPFAVKSQRTLLVAPNLKIANQLLEDLTPSNSKFFYTKRSVLDEPPYPEPAEIRGTSGNLSDLQEADVVITNIQQLQRSDNKWLTKLPEDFFDLIQFDEGHHNVAESWDVLRTKFPDAKILNVSATPSRADGRVMTGSVIYSYPISEAVKKGYVKRINGYRLSPQTLKYVRHEGADEVEVTLEEVRRLGEQDAGFRRSIVSSETTLTTIAEASIRKLEELRENTGNGRLKIIASALNMEHCKQVVAKYRELGWRVDYVHSNLSTQANQRVHEKLENHELDVIVQVRMLGEGFDHPYLSVAAVFSIFSNLGPFMQFVGRIMRTIPGVDPFDEVNDGVVVFHVGGNITGVWTDFQDFAEADQEFFANLVDENVTETSSGDPRASGQRQSPPRQEVTGQDQVRLENLVLIQADPNVSAALAVLREAGVDSGDQFEELKRIVPTRQASRRAKRSLLDDQVKTHVGKFFAAHGLKYAGRDLDKSRENFQVVKSAIDLEIKKRVPSGASKRSEYTIEDLDFLLRSLPSIVTTVEEGLLNG